MRTKAKAAYEALNDSPMRNRIRRQAEVFSAVVYWQPGDYDYATLVREFRRIRETGFTAVRFHTQGPVETGVGQFDFFRSDAWMKAADEAELDVVFHHEHPSPGDAMLAKHGLTRAEFEMLDATDPRFAPPLRDTLAPVVERYKSHRRLYMWVIYGEPSGGARPLDTPEAKAAFGRWLERKYQTVAALDNAWNLYPEKGKAIVAGFDRAWQMVEEGGGGPDALSAVAFTGVKYGAMTDLFRFQSAHYVSRVSKIMDIVNALDPEHPRAVGAHQLFANQPELRWDHGAFARTADLYFSSIHLSWHFGFVANEVDRPVLMMSKLTADMIKGGWASAFETTGGSVAYSGVCANAMTPGLMQRLICAYLAAGNKALAFWTWNPRPGGSEAGEYSLTTLSGAISTWALEAGKLSQLMVKHKREIWNADGEARVGLVQSWDSEAVLLLERIRGGDASQQPVRAQTGAARAMINHRIPFEYVTERELLTGIAGVYDTIYVPHARALSDASLEALAAYVQGGGRLIGDVQFAFVDEHGKLRFNGQGSWQERLFGAWVDTVHDTRTAPMALDGMNVDGLFADLSVPRARVLARFANGAPAVTESKMGLGSAVLVGFDPARMCWRPGNVAMEKWLAELLDGHTTPTFRCSAGVVTRRRSPTADHYFVLNDGTAACNARLDVFDATYQRGDELITGKSLNVDGTCWFDLPPNGAAWVRLERQT